MLLLDDLSLLSFKLFNDLVNLHFLTIQNRLFFDSGLQNADEGLQIVDTIDKASQEANFFVERETRHILSRPHTSQLTNDCLHRLGVKTKNFIVVKLLLFTAAALPISIVVIDRRALFKP